jgi:SAM-dependent methyltransferase
LAILERGFTSLVHKQGIRDITSESLSSPGVLARLFARLPLQRDLQDIDNFDSFGTLVRSLSQEGWIVPGVGSLDWGNLRTITPICHLMGFTRGTPIDRYYLDRFVEAIRADVSGDVVEVGGLPHNQGLYGFERATRYRIMELEAAPGIDVVGDVHDPTCIEANSLDGLVIFNVLEHCHAPWLAAENIHRWLKPGGRCFCMVPNAQRLHGRPHDYWRPLPNAMKMLFRSFAKLELYVYGNPLTVVASLYGVAAEELTAEELDARHPDYPVCTCIVATK